MVAQQALAGACGIKWDCNANIEGSFSASSMVSYDESTWYGVAKEACNYGVSGTPTVPINVIYSTCSVSLSGIEVTLQSKPTLSVSWTGSTSTMVGVFPFKFVNKGSEPLDLSKINFDITAIRANDDTNTPETPVVSVVFSPRDLILQPQGEALVNVSGAITSGEIKGMGDMFYMSVNRVLFPNYEAVEAPAKTYSVSFDGLAASSMSTINSINLKPGGILKRNSNTTIEWHDKSTSQRSTHYNIFVVDSKGKQIPIGYNIPVEKTDNVTANKKYTWTVGKVLNSYIPDGVYTLKVCHNYTAPCTRSGSFKVLTSSTTALKASLLNQLALLRGLLLESH